MPPAKNRRSSGNPDDLKSYIRQSGSYYPQNENRVLHDVQECERSFPSLHPVLDNFTAPDGSTQRLLALRGTIPIVYKDQKYKIPVHIWVMSYHPAGPPLVFVVPTRTMVFRRHHPHVDSNNGLVYMPYLASWDALTSTISGTVNAMIEVFSIKPPVYSRDIPSVSQQEEVDRQRLVKELSNKLSRELRRNTASATHTIQRMHAKQDAMKQEETARQGRQRQLAREKSELEAMKHYMRRRIGDLRIWLQQHPDAPKGATIDDITQPRTALREQVIEYMAVDAAQSDALDQIDEAFASGLMENEEYLRYLRKVARQQFFSRALQRKVIQQMALREKPQEIPGVVPAQQPPPLQAPAHQLQAPATLGDASRYYRPRT